MRIVGLVFMSLLLITSLVVAGCAQQAPTEPESLPEEAAVPEPEMPADGGESDFVITSSAFAEGAEIPINYTCDGQNFSPPLDWNQVPAGTVSFALIMDDPDAGGYTHWVIFNLPPDTRGLPEAVPKDEELASGALQGKIGSGGIGYPIGYFGPCPPKGSPHHYCFILYALDTSLGLDAGASKGQVLQAMEGHILAQSQLIGIYQRLPN